MSFRFSKDDFIASKQQEEADKLIDDIAGNSNIQYSKEIEKLFEKVTFGYLEEFVKLVREEMKEPIVIVAVPRNHSAYHSKMDLKRAYDKLNKPWKDAIPYIEFSFPEEYSEKCPHGDDYMHCFFFFFTEYHEFQASEDCVKYYLNRVNKLKVFL